jgi:hypothetical protein
MLNQDIFLWQNFPGMICRNVCLCHFIAMTTVDAPEEFCCPISFEVMKDPVIMPDCRTYERVVIAEALTHRPFSPFTREPMSMNDARSNVALRCLIQRWRQGAVDESTPADEDDPPNFDELVEILICTVGNDYPIRDIEAALRSDNYDVDRACNFLLSSRTDDSPQVADATAIDAGNMELLLRVKPDHMTNDEAIRFYRDACRGDIESMMSKNVP